MALNLDELQDQINEFTQQLADANIKRIQEIRTTGQVSTQLDDQIKDLTVKLKNLTDTQKKLDELTKTLNTSFMSFGSALLNVSNDITKFSPAVKGAVGSAGLLASGLASASNASPVFVKSIEVVSKTLEVFADALVKYTGTIIKTFDSVATIGGAAGLTATELERLGRESRFSGDDLAVFGNLVKKQGNNLIAFGGGVTDGSKRFAEFINVGEDQLNKYRKLGISQTQLAEYQGFYADNLLKSSISINRSDDGMKKLQQSSLAYRDILYSLSSITGETLEEQQKAQEFAATQSNLNAKLAQQDIELIGMRERASKMAEGAEKDELTARIASTENQFQIMKMFSSLADPAKVGIENATGMLESLAAGGNTMSESIAKMAMMGFDVNSLVQEIMSFSGTPEEGAQLIATGMKDYATAVDEFTIRSGVMATNFGKVSQDYLSSVGGIASESQLFAARIRQVPIEEIFSNLESSVPEDPFMSLQAESEEMARNFREVVSTISANVLPSLTNFASKTLETGNALYEIITGVSKEERNNEVSGAGISGLGAAAIGALGVILAPKIVTSLARRVIGGTPAGTAAAGTAAAAGTSNSSTIRQQVMRPGQIRPTWQTVSNPNYTPPSTPSPTQAGSSKFSRFLQKVSTKLGPRVAGKLALSAGLLAVPGPGWIMALINLGLNASTAWAVYQIWKEFSGSSDTETQEEEVVTGNISSTLGTSPQDLAQTLSQLTGDDTTVGKIPMLTNSFDDLVSTTDLLVEAFGSLSIAVRSTNSGSTASATTPTPQISTARDTGTTSSTATTPALPVSVARNTGTNVSDQQAKDFIINNEGIRYEPYQDTLGNWTVGVGHLIGSNLPPEMNRRFSHDEVMDMFDQDYMHHKTAAQRIPRFNQLDGLGQTALTDLTFNMGPNWLSGWPNLSNQLNEGDIDAAADNLRNSRWYGQVGGRGPRVTNMLDSATISAATGGIASGPETGYLGKLHGTELIQPINSDSILSRLATTPENQPIEINNDSQSRLADLYRSNMLLVDTLNSKLDNMISKLGESNYIQERILSNTV
jgi:lysozyme